MGLQETQWYSLVSHAGKGHCLNVHGVETIADKRNVNIYSREDALAQRWQLKSKAGHALLYSALDCVNGEGRYALDYYWGRGNVGNCDVYTAQGNDADALLEAYTVDAAAGLYRLGLACHAGLYLTATGRRSGSDVRWQPYTGGEEQLWQFVAATEDRATYPCRCMRITQRHDGGRRGDGCSHINNSAGRPADYPVDEAGADGGREYLYCPCAEMEVRRLYGVGNKGTNTVWLRSTAPVAMPGLGQKQHLVMMVVHPGDDTLAGLRVGQRFTRGQRLFLEGDDGLATGYHFHISCGTGDLAALPGCSAGWAKNRAGVWVLTVTGRTLRVDEAFYLDKGFTTVKNDAGYAFCPL